MVIFCPTVYLYQEPFATEVKSQVYATDEEGNQFESSEVTGTVERNGFVNTWGKRRLSDVFNKKTKAAYLFHTFNKKRNSCIPSLLV
jgi:ribosomal protein S6